MIKSLEKRILAFSFLVLALTIAVNTWLSVESFQRNYRDGIYRRCEAVGGSFRQRIEAVLKLGLPIREIEGLSERCTEIVQNDPEIAYCLIESASGELLYFSEAPHPNPSESQLELQLSDTATILKSDNLGRIYDYALPLYDYNDKLVGRLHVGFQHVTLATLTQAHLLNSVLVLGFASLAVFALVALFVRRDLVVPIKRLCGLATEISSGNFTVTKPKLSTDELNLLGDSFEEMSRSLRERDLEIQRNYEELEETNKELQGSYERLEGLSSELGRSREMYRSLLDDASDAILVCDDDDNIILANKAAESFFGLPRVRIEKCNYYLFLETIRCRNAEVAFERHRDISPGESVDSEFRFTRPSDQKTLVGWAISSAIYGKDRKRLVQIIIRDATREEETRHNLERAARELERLNQMKNSFLGLASHELKTPLTIIMGYVELLMNEMSGRLDESTIEMVRHISKASDRLSEIVRDMVDVSMLDSKTLELISQDVDLNLLVKRTIEKANPRLKQRRQTLNLDLATDLPLVRCDVDRIVQAIGNVLENAIKFTPDQGIINIRSRYVERPRLPEKFAQNGHEISCQLSREAYPYVELAIADKGIGIAPAEQEAIFEKFYEVGDVEEHFSEKVAFKGRGAGLGLTIVKGVVALHGGAVWVESPGHDPETMPGSIFYILLPASGHPLLDIPEAES